MLQRAADNAYSWWWASHIRTKQSKWLDQSLQDMEEKVNGMLKLIEEDGDSFAKRAEMYYRRRPELISSVEEAYRVFRALADRYDLVSKELQNANHTIATVFPEQIQFAMDEDDESAIFKMANNSQVPGNNGNIPNVPKAPVKDLKGLLTTASKQIQAKKLAKTNRTIPKSGLTKEEAVEEIDKLQKDILGLQTVKEFVKSSYESGLARYWGIEGQIMEMQQKGCRLQDEFNVDMVIEDDEARTLMAEAALKSCQETLSQLQEKQEKSSAEAKEECIKIEAAHERLKSLRKECINDQSDDGKASQNALVVKKGDRESSIEVVDVIQEMESLKEPIGSMESLTVTELVEKIDKLVNKVITLESAVSSQRVLINNLKTDADDLHAQIQNLENEKATLIDSTHILTTRLKEMEEKLRKLRDLNKNVENQNENLRTNFAEARTNLDHLSEKLDKVKPDEEAEEINESQGEEDINRDVLFSASKKEDEKEDVKEVDIEGESKHATHKRVTYLDHKTTESVSVDDSDDLLNAQTRGSAEKEDELNWQQMLLSGMEDREKILLKEYTTILRNYKDVKKRLGNMEKQERDSQFDVVVQIRELKKAIVKRDEEIQRLRQKLNLLLENKDVTEENSEEFNFVEDLEVHDIDSFSNNEEDDIKLVFIDKSPSVSIVEEKLRMNIDAILDENLDFWLRFSTTFHQIQKFKTEVQDLQDEISKLLEKKLQMGCVTAEQKSEVRPIYKHLREIQTELTVWLEQSVCLKDELKGRFSSLCNIQEETLKP